ncbi:MAG TPA: hypothetical protein ENJ30_01930 [Desulfobulbaceae bacterium]|nr:hypothetical protein [Desulfobulbaceae bacterium]
MHRLGYRITTLSPVIFSSIAGDRNMVATRRYIPGATILGLVAGEYLRQYPGTDHHQDETFYNWFLGGDVCFTNACITVEDEYGTTLFSPAPFSLAREKYDDSGIIYDLLFDDDVEHPEFPGGFSWFGDDELKLCTVATQVRFHHARDRYRGASAKGQIFNYESIAAGQVFSGEIRGSKEDLEALQQLCKSLETVYLGRSRSAEYGKALFTLGRLEQVSQREYPTAAKPGQDGLVKFSLTLESDLILYNGFGYPTTETADLEETLQAHLGPDLTIARAFVRTGVIENFVSKWRLKKTAEPCFLAGSTFLLSSGGPVTADALGRLERKGLGMRLQEGYGRIRFCGQTRKELDAETVTIRRKAEQPEYDPPRQTRSILKAVLRDIVRDEIRLEAHYELEKFPADRLPSPSLCAKLRAMAVTGDRREFVVKINKMRDIALDALKNCVGPEYNLLEFIAGFRLPKELLDNPADAGFEEDTAARMKKLPRNKSYCLVRDLKKPLDFEKEKLSQEKFFLFAERLYRWIELQNDPVENMHSRMKSKTEFSSFQQLGEWAACTPWADKHFAGELVLVFYDTFFSEMRRKKISHQQQEGQHAD